MNKDDLLNSPLFRAACKPATPEQIAYAQLREEYCEGARVLGLVIGRDGPVFVAAFEAWAAEFWPGLYGPAYPLAYASLRESVNLTGLAPWERDPPVV